MSSRMLSLLLAVLCCCLVEAERVRFDGCVNWEITPQDESQLHHLQELYAQHFDMEREMKEQKIYFWNEPKGMKRDQVLVCPRGEAEFQVFLRKSGIRARPLDDSLQRTLDEIFARYDARHEVSTFGYDDDEYNSYEDIMNQLEVLGAACPPELFCSIDNIGFTWENRAIRRFNIRKDLTAKKGIWLDSLMHGREWLTGPTVMGILTKLVRGYGVDEDATYLIDNYNIYVIPVVNPDGYSYTWTDFLMWRKNRQPNEDSICTGTDPNRNFDYYWDAPGASDDPCMENYRGPAPDTQLETRAAVLALTELKDELVLVLAFHSWGHVYLFPYGNKENGICYRSPDYDDLFRVGNACVKAIEATYNETVWEAGTACELFYEASGSLHDWAKAEGITKYAYTPELRPDYVPPPPTEIPPSVEENWRGLVAMVAEYENVEG